MQLKSVSSFGASALLLSVLLSACASVQPAPVLKTAKAQTSRARKFKVRDPLVRSEISTELVNLEEPSETALLGPITSERLALIESRPLPSDANVVLETPTLLAGLLAKKGLASARATVELAKPESAIVETPAIAPTTEAEPAAIQLKTLRSLEKSDLQLSKSSNETPFIFDIPVTYNARVSSWIRYFQTDGRKSFKTWLERSSRYVPQIEDELNRAGLPQDLVYVAMIESGFRPDAVSHMGAMGMWQFISATGKRYGLHIDWWLDERRDFSKSTRAAISYMKDLNQQFNSWYLVTASYNMGETGVRRLMKKYGTNNFWTLADLRALPRETTDYVPKIIAATLIAKAPALYGFRELDYHVPLAFDTIRVPGGTDLVNLAGYLGVSGKYLLELNPELTRGFIPREVRGHQIRVPKGSMMMVSQFTRINQSPAQVTQEAAN